MVVIFWWHKFITVLCVSDTRFDSISEGSLRWVQHKNKCFICIVTICLFCLSLFLLRYSMIKENVSPIHGFHNIISSLSIFVFVVRIFKWLHTFQTFQLFKSCHNLYVHTYNRYLQINVVVSAITPIYVCSGRRHFSKRRNSAFTDDYALNFGGYQSAVDGDLNGWNEPRTRPMARSTLRDLDPGAPVVYGS